MRIFPIIILSIFLTGCGSFKKLDPPVITTNPVSISAEALETCAELNEKINVVTFEEVVEEYSKLGVLYAECANKHAANIKLLKIIGNLK